MHSNGGPGSMLTEAKQNRSNADELIAAARAGDAAAFHDLLVLLSRYLEEGMKHRRLQGMSPSRSAADFVQETVVRVHEHFANFRGESLEELTRWSWRILYRRHQETRRNRRNRTSERMVRRIWSALAANPGVQNQVRLATPLDALEEWEQAKLAYALFKDRLRPDDRNIIQLHLLDDMSYETIAAKVDKNVDTVRRAYGRALERFRKLFEQHGNA